MYNYDVNKIYYYTDGHGQDDMVTDKENRFLDSYFGYEIQIHRWVQIPESEILDLEKRYDKFPRKISYIFDQNGNTLRECHVDSHIFFLKIQIHDVNCLVVT